MSAPRGTTPTLVLTFTDTNLDLTTATAVYVTFKYGLMNDKITKTGEDLEVEAKKITVSFSQAETLNFPEGPMQIQANWTGADGFRAASEIQSFNWSRQLLPEVL